MSDAGPPPAAPPAWLVEVKRQATDRGTLDESTKWNLKLESRPQDGAVSLYRFEVPLNDDDTDFEGSPLRVHVGDVKARVGWRAIPMFGRPFTSFTEVTFPTARPDDRGTGKYQLSGGIRTAFDLGPAWGGKSSFGVQVQQVVSIAGDDARKDINQTKLEFEVRHDRPGGHFVKATAKPVYDWVGRQDGAVLEAEGGWAASKSWSFALMAGGLLWGRGAPGTYGTRVELKAIRRF